MIPPGTIEIEEVSAYSLRRMGAEGAIIGCIGDNHAQFRVEDEEGSRFWLYRDGLYDREIEQQEGKVIQPNWFMHGLFA